MFQFHQNFRNRQIRQLAAPNPYLVQVSGEWAWTDRTTAECCGAKSSPYYFWDPDGSPAPTRDHLTYMPEVSGGYVARQCTSQAAALGCNALLSLVCMMWFAQCFCAVLRCHQVSPFRFHNQEPFWQSQCVDPV